MRQIMENDRNLAANNTKLKNAKSIGSRNFKTNARGITLIALVITIIVLLILAGVSISAITGNDSAMEKAQQAKNASEAGDELDTIKLAVVDAVAHGNTGFVTGETLANALTGLVGSDQISAIRANANGPWEVRGKKGVYKITSNGEVYEASFATISQDTIEFEENGTNTPVTLTINPKEGVTISSVTWSVADDNGLVTINGTSGNSTVVSKIGTPTSATATVTAEVTTSSGKSQTLNCAVTYKENTVYTIAITSPEYVRIFPNETTTITVEGRGKFGGKVELKETDIAKISYYSLYDSTNSVTVSAPDATTGAGTVTGNTNRTATIQISYNGSNVGYVFIAVRKKPENPINLGVDVDGSGSLNDDWEILYDGRDASAPDVLKGKVYCILADFLPNDRREAFEIQTNLSTNGMFNVYLEGSTNLAPTLVAMLNGTDGNWNALVSNTISGITGVKVQGALDKATMDEIVTARGGSYYKPKDTSGYWLASCKLLYGSYYMDYIECNNGLGSIHSDDNRIGILPVVIIPADQVNLTVGADGVTTVTPKTN